MQLPVRYAAHFGQQFETIKAVSWRRPKAAPSGWRVLSSCQRKKGGRSVMGFTSAPTGGYTFTDFRLREV